jgi:hypothetical protein
VSHENSINFVEKKKQLLEGSEWVYFNLDWTILQFHTPDWPSRTFNSDTNLLLYEKDMLLNIHKSCCGKITENYVI